MIGEVLYVTSFPFLFLGGHGGIFLVFFHYNQDVQCLQTSSADILCERETRPRCCIVFAAATLQPLISLNKQTFISFNNQTSENKQTFIS